LGLGRISDNQKETIRSRIDMVQLVSEYVELQPRGSNDFWGRCPFHEERSASFHIRPDRGIFKCFGCGKGGDIFSFVGEMEGVSFVESLERLAKRAGVELRERTPEERAQEARRAELLRSSEIVASFYERVLWSNTPAGAEGRGYLERRGISRATAEAFGIGVAPDRWDALTALAKERGLQLDVLEALGLVRSKNGRAPYDFFRHRLMFPIRSEQGKVVAFGGRTLGDDKRKYMNSPEVPGLYEKRKLLYGLDRAKKGRPKRLVVVEGYMDVVLPHQFERTEFVASLGTAFTPEQARLARRYVDEVVLLFDSDPAGRDATLRALSKLVSEDGLTVKVASLPEGMDPDDAVRRDPALLDRALDEADDLVGYIMERTLEGYDQSSPAGQTRTIRAAIKLLAQIPDKLRLSCEIKPISERFGIPADVLREELTQASQQAAQQQRRSAARGGDGPPDAHFSDGPPDSYYGAGPAEPEFDGPPDSYFDEGPPPSDYEDGPSFDGPPAGGRWRGGGGRKKGKWGKGKGKWRKGRDEDEERMLLPGPVPAVRGPVEPLERHLLEALLAIPDGASQVLTAGGDADLFTPGPAQVLAGVIFQLAAGGPVEPAQVLGRLEDPVARDLCDQLSGRIHEDKDYARDLEGWIVLRRRLIKRRRAELQRQILAAEDQETRNRLLLEKTRLNEEPA
jgi:DNA primase